MHYFSHQLLLVQALFYGFPLHKSSYGSKNWSYEEMVEEMVGNVRKLVPFFWAHTEMSAFLQITFSLYIPTLSILTCSSLRIVYLRL